MKFNPFVPNGIAYPGMFIGRLDEIQTIEQALFQTLTATHSTFCLLVSAESENLLYCSTRTWWRVEKLKMITPILTLLPFQRTWLEFPAR